MAESINEYRFHVHGFTPESIPMERLAEYMMDLASLLGHPHSVHFIRVDPGSLGIVHYVEAPDIPKVQKRLYAISKDPDNAPPDAMAAYHAINARLESDNTRAEIFADDNVIEFPGVTIREPEVARLGPIVQRDSVVGVPIMIGGKRDLVPIHIETEKGVVVCHAKRGVARRLGKYLFEDVIKAVGEARWVRTEEDGWTIEDFLIDDFDTTEDRDLEQSLELIRRVTDGHWKTEDPVAELIKLRRDE